MAREDSFGKVVFGSVSSAQVDVSDAEGEKAIRDLSEPRHIPRDVMIGLPKSFGFELALDFMKRGFKVRREGWNGIKNGKDMWICRGQGARMDDPEKFWNPHTRDYARKRKEQGLDTEVLPYIIMKTADHKILMGWLASQTDMLAEDWELVE